MGDRIAAWLAVALHYDNMTSPGYAMVACGFHVTSGGAVWAVQDFR